MSRRDWRPFFPFAEPRSEQAELIDFVLASFLDDGKKFVVVDAGTGIGKSAVGVTVARYLRSLEGGGAYFLTTQKVLTAQYVRDFSPHGLLELRSADNYVCEVGRTCAVTRRVARACRRPSPCAATCPYAADKKLFLEGDLGVTNYAYFLNETTYAGKLEPRNLVVMDECHNIESTLTSFASIDVSDKVLRAHLGRSRMCKVPWGADQRAAFEWMSTSYRGALGAQKLKLERDMARGKVQENAERYERLDKHLCRVNRLVDRYEESNWILCEEDGRDGRTMSFRPVRIDDASQETLFERGRRVLMMSATVLDKGTFCRWLGLKPEEVAYARRDCPFPIENRPIHYLPVGRMSKSDIDATLPKAIDIVRGLLELHAGEKGIVHCVTHKIARRIRDELRDPRILYPEDGKREAVLREHAATHRPTVLLSPSMTEGVDLADDLSRFQVFVKLPFPSLGDRVVARRMELDPKWYALATARSIVQGVGRSVRSATDSATTYVLDACWEDFYRRNAQMFPDSFRAALASTRET